MAGTVERRAVRRFGSAAAALVALALLAVGCSDSGDGDAAPATGDAGTTACTPEGQEKPAKALLRCGGSSIAFVENPWGSGTGIVTEVDGTTYVLTNAHVVDPFRTAEVTIGEGDTATLPVVGSDVAADIALIGPVEDRDAEPLPLSSGTDIEKGDDVFAVGYPGDNPDDDRELTVASGIVSRVRKVADFDQTYLQTDATIASGQSGGPLFDDRGRVLGITGLSDEDFGFALVGADVEQASERVAAGDGDDLLTVPASADEDGEPAAGGETSGTATIAGAADGASLYLPPSDERRTWKLSVPTASGDITVEVLDELTGDPIAASASGRRLATDIANQVAAAMQIDPAQALAEVQAAYGGLDPAIAGRETAPGEFTIELDADQGAEVDIYAPLSTSTVEVAWSSDQPMWPLSRPIETESMNVGDTVEGILSGYDSGHDVTVDLEEGQQVELWARSPQGDMNVTVVPPGATVDAVSLYAPEARGLQLFEDSDVGLFGYDVQERYTAEATGTYRFALSNYDAVPVAWRFTVTDCDEDDACHDR
ncbi:S1C family serine protease [Dermatobacter hominis]|uniref:S1C family serine protease n=1 Tax=Dermatobacter hominis TaxID=2884263 RepID=UPI001D12743D|nr:serine protease [Dermatobacter hominis]UDY36332.1 serine protease [Dermatobacter hominis]